MTRRTFALMVSGAIAAICFPGRRKSEAVATLPELELVSEPAAVTWRGVTNIDCRRTPNIERPGGPGGEVVRPTTHDELEVTITQDAQRGGPELKAGALGSLCLVGMGDVAISAPMMCVDVTRVFDQRTGSVIEYGYSLAATGEVMEWKQASERDVVASVQWRPARAA